MEVICDYVCSVTENNIKIIDSYKVENKSKMKEVLYAIQYKHPECKVFKRSYNSMIAEWKTHNRLYHLGIKKSHTKDVDINYPIKWYVELLYRIFGI